MNRSILSALAIVSVVVSCSNSTILREQVEGRPTQDQSIGGGSQGSDAGQGNQRRLPQLTKWTRLVPAIRRMKVDTPMSFIGHPQLKHETLTISQPKSSGFSWKSCGSADQLVEIKSLTIQPSPLLFPGQISFGFDINFHDTIAEGAKVSANLLLEYSASTGSWIKIPCIGQIGSCVYEDVCSLSQAIVCPDELKQRGIPCTCPINKGEYNLPNFSADVQVPLFLSGDYKATANFTDSVKGPIACYQVTFSIG